MIYTIRNSVSTADSHPSPIFQDIVNNSYISASSVVSVQGFGGTAVKETHTLQRLPFRTLTIDSSHFFIIKEGHALHYPLFGISDDPHGYKKTKFILF